MPWYFRFADTILMVVAFTAAFVFATVRVGPVGGVLAGALMALFTRAVAAFSPHSPPYGPHQ